MLLLVIAQNRTDERGDVPHAASIAVNYVFDYRGYDVSSPGRNSANPSCSHLFLSSSIPSIAGLPSNVECRWRSTFESRPENSATPHPILPPILMLLT